jgi:hypothetical protein
MARVFGLAGPGFEAPLAALLGSGDEQTAREALRSLARIGTTQAASIVATHIQQQDGWASAAEESLWRFPGAEAQRQVRALLGRREFVLRHAGVASHLRARAAGQPRRAGRSSPCWRVAPRIWNPPLARLGRRAKALMHA